jgi:prepilin-type N-terminal cleavage/methylation domain-containing protein
MVHTRGYTLVEVLVVVAVAVVLLGLVLEALITTNRASDELMLAQEARQEALFIAQKLEKYVRGRVEPTEVANGEGETFLANQVAFYSTTFPEGLARLEIQNDSSKKCAVVRAQLPNSKTVTVPLRSVNVGRLRSEISFRFGMRTDKLEAQWLDEATTTPQLIGYSIRVWPDQPRFASYKDAVSPRGTKLGFEYISAVKLP